ncbi:hypothetical protein A3H65_01855 [Candidatus Giovannonibacteria bacterium RIFCSPLOWO2_02_FULL_45_14]|uniref:Uncharacterized protein n=1 Tax=Candidatus Giovannonibacteria bacterium RIFCSPLOWO2_12_FULL_44_15 TaxID=1798364 RepID=A0A1F5XZN7_9BACT|nr:MAG: hypothetical protein A3C75_04000 [Candidatus Giovannonibacteria bacterium RIFCSPHIGHO2_02_FULL_44_31]OGF91196.1 MAG: hypothetical protein A3H65_01855 [Candidatus Giovannonibacteria bacterium RIFCSPLOWO2_02_FULL_45_14]OGF93353.1 MAG: hypothetical protein A3G54_00435 [Candidatus Giovannonibacteria bacterium RIFCSPLOWO2_12_FULL_44_15]
MNLKIIVVSLTAGILLFAGYFAGRNYLRPVFRQNGTIYFESDPYFKNWDSGKQREYCAANGGKVNECGPLCENCVAAVCSLTCEFAAADISTWQTYRNEKYGFEVKYPADLIQKINDDGFPTIYISDGWYSGLSINTAPLDTLFKVGNDSYKLQYDQNTNEWIRGTFDDAKNDFVFKPNCEKITPLGVQRVPSYAMGRGRAVEYVVILRDKFLIFSEAPDEPIVPPWASDIFNKVLGTIKFNDPGSILKAICK